MRADQTGRYIAGAILLLSLAAAPGTALAERSGEKRYTMQAEGQSFTVRRVASQPLPTGAPNAPSAPALRLGGAKDAAQALRAIEAFCGYPAGQLKDFGAHGDAFYHDRARGEWVVWFDCLPGQG